MRTVQLILALLISGLLAAPVSATKSGVVGVGVGTCGEFAKMYAQNPEMMEVSFFAWAQGLMSGINAGFKTEQMTDLHPADFPVKSQQAFLRRYCADNPLRTYYDAVFELYIFMRSRQGIQ